MELEGIDTAGLLHVSGAGNSFALLDARGAGEPARADALARELCGGGVLQGGAADGLLVLCAPRGAADLRLVVWNADGSRAAACGNGLRCAAWYVFRRAASASASLVVETDCGPRPAQLVAAEGASARVRVGMGRALRMPRIAAPSWEGRELEATGVELGNPHCVLRVHDERSAPVEELGRALQRHPDFPEGVNVGFLARRDARWRLRVFERGVGETAACGSGACAAAVASGALERERAGFEVAMPGGLLLVQRDPSGELALTGAAEELGPYPSRARA